SFNLKKLQLGYIDVNIRPPQKVAIFVNDRRVDEARFNLRNYAIPSNQSILVKVVSGDGKVKSQKVMLKENESKTLEFKLDPPSRRVPSGN
ncbi:hypothetical protein GW916_13220, partial [bacterium]|nr:hypothetical protein [bacterium]